MKKNDYPCKMIEDLIPLCAENLCSAESRAAVEAHIAGCENCRKLAADLPVGKPLPVPDEKAMKPFRKVRRKMVLDRVLLGVCAVVICGLAYLTYGQIAKPTENGFQSFDTIAANIKMRKYAKMAAEGRFNELAPHISLWDLWQRVGTEYTVDGISTAEEILESDIEKLNAAYTADIGGDSVKKIKMHSGYGSFMERAPAVYTEATITYASGKTMTLDFITAEDGGIRFGCTMYSDDIENLGRAYRYACAHEPGYSTDVFESLLVRGGSLEEGATRYKSLKMRMAESAQEQFMQNVGAFYGNAGYRMKRAEFSDVQYDMAKKQTYWEVMLEAEDTEGTAILLTRMTLDDKGRFIPQDAGLDRVYTDGCTPALAESLRGFFGGR